MQPDCCHVPLMLWPATLLLAALLALVACRPEGDDYHDLSLAPEERAHDLVARMTLEEKISQLGFSAPAIERLGIPQYNWWNECLHGVARAGVATVFPQAIGLAATWDTLLVRRMAEATSDEARAKHHEAVRQGQLDIYRGLTFWSPNINIFRDPRWGRGQETYGEDPYLTSRLGVQFVRGLQGDHPRYLKLVATPKHYAVHSGPEPERHAFDARVEESDLRQTYLPAFRATVVEAGAASVMCAYNRFLGEPCCGSSLLLARILREEWGFAGYVVSDCWAIADFHLHHKVTPGGEESAALAIAAGTDLNCGDIYQQALLGAVRRELVSESEVDVAAERLFTARFRLGMFDPPEQVPFAQIPYDVVDSPEHRALARQAARESIVLLKNQDALLPLDRTACKTIAVVGPTAHSRQVLLGNYNGTPSHSTTLLEGIRQALPSGSRALYSRGCELAEQFIPLEEVPAENLLPPAGETGTGFIAQVFDSPEASGPPVATVRDTLLKHLWSDNWPGLPGPADHPYAVRWSGRLSAPLAGTYRLGANCPLACRIYVDEALVAGKDSAGANQFWGEAELTAGEHAMRIEADGARGKTTFELLWELPAGEPLEQVLAESELVVACLGLSPLLEGEEMPVSALGFRGGDRLEIGLPHPQEQLLERLIASGKPLVLVLTGGSALAIPRADAAVSAILMAWYPGEEGGAALAEVLFGDHSPAGRLPVTFYRELADLPPFDDYGMQGRTYRYFQGQPLYPFGHGLSYTRFAYRDLRIEPATAATGQTVRVSVELENVGEREAEEVAQLYLTDREASWPVPLRALAGFRRLSLAPGEKRRIEFTLEPWAMSLVDDTGRRLVEPGRFLVTVGGKQPGFTGSADAATTMTVAGEFELTGQLTELDQAVPRK